jgi:hypothetical protein
MFLSYAGLSVRWFKYYFDYSISETDKNGSKIGIIVVYKLSPLTFDTMSEIELTIAGISGIPDK